MKTTEPNKRYRQPRLRQSFSGRFSNSIDPSEVSELYRSAKITRTRNLALIVLCLSLFSGCAHDTSTQTKIPANYIEAGTVTPHGVWTIKKELSEAGIIAYSDGSQYPLPYRILVAPENKDRASAIISEIKKRSLSAGY